MEFEFDRFIGRWYLSQYAGKFLFLFGTAFLVFLGLCWPVVNLIAAILDQSPWHIYWAMITLPILLKVAVFLWPFAQKIPLLPYWFRDREWDFTALSQLVLPTEPPVGIDSELWEQIIQKIAESEETTPLDFDALISQFVSSAPDEERDFETFNAWCYYHIPYLTSGLEPVPHLREEVLSRLNQMAELWQESALIEQSRDFGQRRMRLWLARDNS
ncbi:hypothetical protein [Candidatus Entotheonella palauensis]|uniref:hypothetical protein n=1 Tax=Candidatus Entotheonella palauensis TaxID=93172 RepID=UPI000B7FF3AD|nr:hypothetical protein [Candidatus Entotheonella palauensis]